MKHILIVTSHFPYYGGEQFLETEIDYYCRYHNVKVTLLPLHTNKEMREVPSCVRVSDFFNNQKWEEQKMFYTAKAFSLQYIYRELFSHFPIQPKKFKIFLASASLLAFYRSAFEQFIQQIDPTDDIVFYTYWHNEAAYALQSLKGKYGFGLVSRIHRYDLYEEVRPYGYMPMKRQFTQQMDTLYTITESANDYLKRTYGFNQDILVLSRLGVADHTICAMPTDKNVLHLVSCSFLTEVKQVDKIIKSLKIIASRMKGVNFSWTHIGDGILYDDLLLLAENELSNLENVKYDFVGNYANDEVYEFYAKNKIDVFLNVSLSEGVPVSIMEAMSCHIPIVAPNVGGIKDMVLNGYNGFLLSNECSVNEIVASLKNMDFFKNKEIRKNAYKVFLEKYDAKRNYTGFIENIMSMAK